MIACLSETSKEQRGMLRAATEQVVTIPIDGGWITSSVGQPGRWHLVKDNQCDCLGFQYTGCCKHVMAVELAAAQTHTCQHCGHTGGDVGRFIEHVGGVGDAVAVYWCRDRQACWNRWDQQHGMGRA